MVFQSAIPVAMSLAFTDWRLDALNMISVGLAFLGGAYLYVLQNPSL